MVTGLREGASDDEGLSDDGGIGGRFRELRAGGGVVTRGRVDFEFTQAAEDKLAGLGLEEGEKRLRGYGPEVGGDVEVAVFCLSSAICSLSSVKRVWRSAFS